MDERSLILLMTFICIALALIVIVSTLVVYRVKKQNRVKSKQQMNFKSPMDEEPWAI